MFDLGDPDVLWLNMTNLALGIVTLVCVILVSVEVFGELLSRRKRTTESGVELDHHALHVGELGLTMADGGEPVQKDEPKKG